MIETAADARKLHDQHQWSMSDAEIAAEVAKILANIERFAPEHRSYCAQPALKAPIKDELRKRGFKVVDTVLSGTEISW